MVHGYFGGPFFGIFAIYFVGSEFRKIPPWNLIGSIDPLLGGPGWLHNCSYNRLIRPVSGGSKVIAKQ